jgi:2-polyprenyl-3-methyl-5-hydroxy-6-metoxy-1,4-benzoquinol methylase
MARLRFLYSLARLPRYPELQFAINQAAERLYARIAALDISSLPISDYNKRYFGGYQKDLFSVLQRTAYIVCWSVSACRKRRAGIVFVDYGGGSGMISLLAKELGLGTVIYDDIYDVSCRDAQVIGDALGVSADSYVCGDVDRLLEFVEENELTCDVMASFDVLEHIYDVGAFLTALGASRWGPNAICMASAANSRHPLLRKSLMAMHRCYEFQDRPKTFGHKERDSLRAFYEIRREMIMEHAPELSSGEVRELTENTRGMVKSDILRCVDKYLQTKLKPPEPVHPTNTCDPYTGNWQEQLLDLEWLKRTLQKQGFSADIIPGYYGCCSGRLKNAVIFLLNGTISLSGYFSLIMSPYYVLFGVRR